MFLDLDFHSFQEFNCFRKKNLTTPVADKRNVYKLLAQIK